MQAKINSNNTTMILFKSIGKTTIAAAAAPKKTWPIHVQTPDRALNSDLLNLITSLS